MSFMRFIILALAAIIAATPAAAEKSYAKISTTKGDIIIELDAAKAPKTVANFLQYATDGHYDRTLIHRVVAGVLFQGGGYSRIFSERPTRQPIPYEGENGLKNRRGTIAMARQDKPETATSQWFINLRDNESFDHRVTALGPIYGYAVFGRVVEGMDVADAIGAAATGPGGIFPDEVPTEEILINRIDPAAWTGE